MAASQSYFSIITLASTLFLFFLFYFYFYFLSYTKILNVHDTFVSVCKPKNIYKDLILIFSLSKYSQFVYS